MLAAMITLQQVSRVTDQSRFMGHESACQDIDGRREARLDGLEGVWWLVGWEAKTTCLDNAVSESAETPPHEFEGDKNY